MTALPILTASWGCTCARCGHAWLSVCVCGPRVTARPDGMDVHRPGCVPPTSCPEIGRAHV